MKSKFGSHIFLGAAAVLLCLALISAHFTFGMYARFTTGGKGSDRGRAAAFHVTASPAEGNTSNSYSFTVTNSSETAIRFDVTVRFEQEVAGTVGFMGENYQIQNNVVTIPLSRFLAPGKTSDEITLQMDLSGGNGGQEAFNDFTNESTTGGENVDFTVVVNCTQVN